MLQTHQPHPKIALLLTGGGARAAYQVGVLKALQRILNAAHHPLRHTPFQILCGTSAGAINAVSLACGADHFGTAVRRITDVWENFHAEHVYRSDSLGVLQSGARWLTLLSLGWALRRRPRSLLDNSPLAELLERTIDLARMDHLIDSGLLHAVAVTASNYTTGQHVTFYETKEHIEPWVRTQRIARPDRITVQHLLASSAIPFVFPAVPLTCDDRRMYFGDGAMRQLAPISPAIHLGAERVLVVGAGQLDSKVERRQEADTYPSLAQVAGHALSSIFLDSLAVDIERLQRVNKTLALMPAEVRAQSELHPVNVLVIAPSQRLDELASRFVGDLPIWIRGLLGSLGATEKRGSALASYVLFEQSYTRELISLGEHDTLNQRDEVLKFFDLGPAPSNGN